MYVMKRNKTTDENRQKQAKTGEKEPKNEKIYGKGNREEEHTQNDATTRKTDTKQDKPQRNANC